jgi:hypothetical protein
MNFQARVWTADSADRKEEIHAIRVIRGRTFLGRGSAAPGKFVQFVSTTALLISTATVA